jgi:hypothetical protein
MGRGGGGGRPRVNPRDFDSYRVSKPDTPAAGPIPSAGTSDDGTAFKDSPRADGKHDIWFNKGKEDGGTHGHVVETRHADGDRTYDHARDVSQERYIDKPSNGGS